jgi:hypothetical protein
MIISTHLCSRPLRRRRQRPRSLPGDAVAPATAAAQLSLGVYLVVKGFKPSSDRTATTTDATTTPALPGLRS